MASTYPRLMTLGCDPGERTFAYSLVDLSVYRNQIQAKVITSGYVLSTIRNLTNKVRIEGSKKNPIHVPHLTDSHLNYHDEISTLIASLKADRLIAERFQSRGQGGKTIEVVSYMLGLLVDIALANGISFPTLVIASEWKNAINRLPAMVEGQKNTEYLYALAKEEKGVQPHSVDSALLAVYDYSVAYQAPLTMTSMVKTVRTIPQGLVPPKK